MTSNLTLESVRTRYQQELVFAGDGVRLAGQIDYPVSPTRSQMFPLIFVLHHAGCEAHDGYQAFADLGLDAGYAVFRWDKRGTGHSGASGRGSTTQDAVNAYEIALEQPHVDRRRVVILAQDAGAGLLGSSFGLFARVQLPHGVILATNTLNGDEALAIESRLLVVMGQNDWHPWQQYGKQVCDVHNQAYQHGASYYVAPYANRMLVDPRTESLHYGVQNVILDWLRAL
ncbi:MAG TPA: hypothetical protein VHO69_12870 [Phototrophicaceae bacterium]|nr:hypothetical protein [Phototrophicaceae bacterium]